MHELQQLPLQKLYISIPEYMHIPAKTKDKLKNLAQTNLQFIDEHELIKKLHTSSKEISYNVVLSISKRGRQIYRSLQKYELSQRIEHINLSVTRNTIQSHHFPFFRGKDLLIIDDIFCSGLTLGKLADVYGKTNRIYFLFLFGPKNTIQEFTQKYSATNLYYGCALQEDPRKLPIKFTDLPTICNEIQKPEKPLFLKRAFGENIKEVAYVLQTELVTQNF
ncbi:MAG TPA: hypothetical protein VLB73_01120 [Patescibacteria group bacterium]|nr:hypothetical protein [Patescibacteria group bacterium]